MTDSPQAARWRRIKAILGDALELPRDQQQAYIARHAGDTQELRELQSLRDADQAAGPGTLLDAGPSSFMMEEAVQARFEADWVGREVGGYRLLALIARGGMGQVYRAAPLGAADAPQVAVKFMRDGLVDAAMEQRFMAERQLLSRLDHPNLARLLDSGIAEGRPYFVMELVAGEPIDAYCGRHALGLAQRLALFRTLCEVVHYAHGQGVVHRDLKPANVLVTAQGEVKLVDFGIAKDIGDPAQTGTATAMRVMTLSCASPEQVRGQPITPASDIYSLGVLLYNLLTGRSPYRLAAAGDDLDVRKAICETKPPRPSRMVAGDVRAALRGDLDAVVMAALEKAPGRRYASAHELGEDVRRYLCRLPVHVRWGWAYRAVGFVRRRRVLAAAGLAAGAFAAAGLAVVLHSWSQAARQVEIARQQLAGLQREIGAALESQDRLQAPPSPGAAPAEVPRLQAWLDSLARLGVQGPREAGFDAGLGWAYLRIARLQGGPDGAHLADDAAASQSYQAALSALDRALPEGAPAAESRAVRAARVQARGGWARLLAAQGRAQEARAMAVQAVAEARELERPEAGGGSEDRCLAAAAQLDLAEALGADGVQAQAGEALESALALLRAMRKDDPADLAAAELLARAHVQLARHLLSVDVEEANSASRATSEFLEGAAVLDALSRGHPRVLRWAVDLAVAQSGAGQALLLERQPAKAVDSSQRARDSLQALHRAVPGLPSVRQRFAEASQSLAKVLLASGAPGTLDAAVEAAADAAEAFEALERSRPGDRAGRLRHAQARYDLGQALMARAPVSREGDGQAIPADWLAACDQFRLSLDRMAPFDGRSRDAPLAPDATRIIEMQQVLRTCPRA